MKTLIFEDEHGFKRARIVRDDDDDPSIGIPTGIDVSLIDWEAIKRDLNNGLIDRGLFTLEDVYRSQNGVSAIINAVLKRNIINLYKVQNQGGLKNG